MPLVTALDIPVSRWIPLPRILVPNLSGKVGGNGNDQQYG
jgi:hypothetical protein